MPIDSGRLSISVHHADGRVTRWGPDEVDGRSIPNDLTFSTSVPGGNQDMSCSLLRRIDQDYPDQGLFDTVTVYGAGNRIVWQGRMQQFPRSHGASYQITPGAVGWAAHLRDDPSFSEVFVDRDLTRWGEGTTTRRSSLLTGGSFNPYGNTAVLADLSGAPALETSFEEQGGWDGTHQPMAEAWYDAGGGNYIGRVRASWTRANGDTPAGPDGFYWQLLISADDNHVSYDATGDLQAAGPGTADRAATLANRRWATFQFLYNGGGGGGVSNRHFGVRWTDVRVFGNHGLTIRGATAATEGFYASDIIPSILSQAAPMLMYTTGTDGSIEPTSFVIPHLAFRDPTVPEDAIAAVNAYHLYDWGVYDNREFFFRQPDPDRMLWEARLGDGAFMDADGLTGEQVINGVFVTYTDAAGDTKTVGPPGSGFDATSSLLADTSNANPVNAAGIPRKWTPLTLSVPTNQEGAQTIGAAYLAERSMATRRGSMTLTGTAVTHPTEGKVPVWRVRAGDWIRVADLNGDNADVPRKVISTTYSHQSRSVTLSLDNTVAKLDAILARVGIQAGVTTGGGF